MSLIRLIFSCAIICWALTHTVYTFSEHIINPVMVTHIIFSLVFCHLGTAW